ncbi:hypothetical protein [Ornithinimicrobium sp. INDO-MA30-4]|uniref:hypothetical protein n=1 Tax=Ornithinimicrobium sp. INDO-MA30-4 TaxID=2908651 RepID=UPI001F29FF6B|nr:hypothetical protein [Ornithinimicrobium sp. INDO-MA30-4]UJH69960.1 hypothetical protein L0A91_12110 [Ornithinimicrobium sp. INDO-MA30-4]
MSKSGGPFDKRLVTLVPSARKPLVLLAALGVIQGLSNRSRRRRDQPRGAGHRAGPARHTYRVAGGGDGGPCRGQLASRNGQRPAGSLGFARTAPQPHHSLVERSFEQAIEPATRAALASQGVTAIEPYVTNIFRRSSLAWLLRCWHSWRCSGSTPSAPSSCC